MFIKHKPPEIRNPIERQFSKIGRYQIYFYGLVFMSKIPIFWHILNFIFLSPPISFYCNATEILSVEESTIVKNRCPCDKPWWDHSVFRQTVQTKFQIYCDRNWMIKASESISFVGCLVGSLSFGFFSDKFGRLTSLTLSCFLLGVAGSLVSAMPSIASFCFMRCVEGIGVGGAIVTAYVLCIECCGVNHRETITALFHVPINLSHITLAGISYLFRHCDEFQLALSLPVFLIVFFKWLIYESPKWLLDNGQVDTAVQVMEKIQEFNGRSTTNLRNEIETFQTNRMNQKIRKINFLQIFKHKQLALNLACMSFIYFVCGMGYYGVSQYIGQMSGNIHANVAISGALLLPGTISAAFLLRYLPRRLFLISTSLLSGVIMIIDICIPSHWPWCRVVFACICNCFFFMSFIVVFLYGVELFPTSVRNSVLGFLSFLSRFGQIVAPLINALSPTIAGAIFGIFAIISALLVLLLPETKNTELPSSLEDSKYLSKRRVSLLGVETVQQV